MENDDLRKLAKRRIKAKHDFWNFLGVWAALSVLLVAIWLITNGGNTSAYFWPLWPILGLGIAAFFMWLDAYGPSRRLITEEDIDNEVRRMTRRTDGN
jgi:hypothetical protein